MGRRILVGTVATLVVSAAVASAGTPLTKAQYRAKTNAACRAFNTKMAAVPTPSTRAQYVTFYRALVRYAPIQIDGMAKLTPPPSLRAAHVAVIAADKALITRLRRLLPKLSSGALTVKQLQTDKAIIKQGTREETAFQELGASGCL